MSICLWLTRALPRLDIYGIIEIHDVLAASSVPCGTAHSGVLLPEGADV